MLISLAVKQRERQAGALGGLLMATTALAGLTTAFPAAAQSTATVTARDFSIPAQPLGAALTAFGRQSGLQVSVDAAAIRGVQSPGASGHAAPMQALGRLLNGTGFTYRLDGDLVTLERAPDAADGAIMLGAVRVQGAVSEPGLAGLSAGSGPAPADAPYRTAGSSAYISQEAIQRNRGVSTGDFLSGTPGVINSDNRNSGALDVNIRGMQGMDRVPVVIDGSLQQSTVYRGYSGVAGRTYLDPDLVGSVTIEKGPSASADGVGATGGVVRVETIGVNDLVAPDGVFGAQVRVGLTGNTVAPPAPGTLGAGKGTAERFNRPGALNFNDGQSLSIALGRRFDRFDLVAAYTHREVGNYFSGESGLIPNAYGVQRYDHGEEVLSSSQKNTSYLLRAVIRPTDEQALDLSYMRYESDFGETMPSQIIRYGGPLQSPLSRTEVDTWTGRYRYKPAGSRLIDLKADAWSTANYTSIETLYRYVLWDGSLSIQDVAYMSQSDRWGLNLSNTSGFDTPVGPLAVNYGASYTHERISPPKGWKDYKDNSNYPAFLEPRDGERDEYSAFVAGELKPNEWLTLNAALRYTDTQSRDYNLVDVTAGSNSNRVTGYNRSKSSGVSPILSLLVEPTPGLQFYVRYAEAIRAPSLFESTTGFSFYPDPRNPVRPERAKNTELGVNYQRDSVFMGGDVLQTKFAVFSNHVDDYLTRGESDGLTSVVNIGRAEFQGVELNARYDVGRFFAEAGGALYTHTQFCDTDKVCREGNTINSYIPAHIPPKRSLAVTLGARLLDEDLTLGARYRHVGGRDTSVVTYGGSMAVLDWTPYDLVDLWGAYRINDSISLDFAVDNVTDRYYMDALTMGLMPSPGRTFRLNLTSRFGGPPQADSLAQRTRSVESVLNQGVVFGDFDGDWSGLRVGLLAGHEWLKSRGQTSFLDGSTGPVPASESADVTARDARLGLMAGYDWQVADRWVVGVQGEGSWGSAKANQDSVSGELRILREPDGTPLFPDDIRMQARTLYSFDWNAALRARVGYTFGRAMIYGAGGPAWARESQTRLQYVDKNRPENLSSQFPYGSSSGIGFSEKTSKIRKGWTLGGGAELALDNHWTVRAEYFYTHFGKQDFNFDQARAGVGRSYVDRIVTGYDPNGEFCFDIGEDQPLCIPMEIPIYQDTPVTGTYDMISGRRARNDAELHTLRVGLTYRF